MLGTDIVIYLKIYESNANIEVNDSLYHIENTVDILYLEGTFSIDATVTNDWVQGWSLPINGNRDIPNANYKVRKQSEKGWKYRHRDLIDLNEVWKMDKGLTWKEINPLIESWLEQNPNIKIKYGQ